MDEYVLTVQMKSGKVFNKSCTSPVDKLEWFLDGLMAELQESHSMVLENTILMCDSIESVTAFKKIEGE